MVKTLLKITMLSIMVLGIVISFANFFSSSINAVDGQIVKEEKSVDIGDPSDPNYIIYCDGPGQGCYTVVPVK